MGGEAIPWDLFSCYIFLTQPTFPKRTMSRIAFWAILPIAIPVLFWTLLLNIVSLELPSDLTNSSISLLIAHPDDEAMFFGPTLARLSLPKYRNNVTIICFSSGNFDGIGETRKRELVASAGLFKIPATNVRVIDDLRFPDSQQILWNETLLASEITDLLSPSTKILTFDQNGVSGHANHKAIYHASALEKSQTGRDVFVLKSLPMWRKYTFFYDAVVSSVASLAYPDESSIFVLSTQADVAASQAAMTTAHKSQMRWFRYGWIYLSRYMVANDLSRL